MLSSRMIGDHDPLPVQLDEVLSQELNSVTGKPLSVMNLQPLLQRTPDLTCAIISIQSPQQLCKWSLPSVLYLLHPVGSWPLPFSLGQSFDEVPLSEDGRNQQNHKGAVAASFLAAGITHSRRPLQFQTLEREI